MTAFPVTEGAASAPPTALNLHRERSRVWSCLDTVGEFGSSFSMRNPGSDRWGAQVFSGGEGGEQIPHVGRARRDKLPNHLPLCKADLCEAWGKQRINQGALQPCRAGMERDTALRTSRNHDFKTASKSGFFGKRRQGQLQRNSMSTAQLQSCLL